MSLDSAILKQAGEGGSLGSQNVTQAAFREQINAINDAVRELGGRVKIGPSDAVLNDPLNTPYILYVNRDIGDDTLVIDSPYDYSTQAGMPEEEKDPMRRISQQRLHSGYTQARPFKTLNRAVIEAGILTSRDYLDCCDNSRTNMRVTIVVTGEMEVLNNKNSSDPCSNYFDKPLELSDKKWTPGASELIKFNPADGGLLLPRGVSVVSLDLRKSIIRPAEVPCPTKENPTKSNRQAILKVTGQGYYYGFTFMDECSNPSSHHLLDCFQFASKDELIEFYVKINRKFGNVIPFNEELVRADKTEFEIVGPNPVVPTEAVDTTSSASPYIYNCSIRSSLGLCGIFCDGNKVEGFKSLVCAQFTGVSLQRDLNAWEKYLGDKWGKYETYNDLITKSPDDVRMRPGWQSFHIRAINNAVIQEVSVFAIGQGVHHWVESGGEITITNSNSNFGLVAALAEGYNSQVAITDRGWNATALHRALNPFEKSQSWGLIALGNLVSVANNVITFEEPIVQSTEYPNEPDAVARLGFTLAGVAAETSYIWVRNPTGADYRAKLAANPWDPEKPNQIKIAEAFKTDKLDGNRLPGSDENSHPPLASGEADSVYIRRYQDTRNRVERTFWLTLDGCGEMLRDPYRDYVIRDENDKWSKQYLSAVARSKRDQSGCDQVNVTLRNANDTVSNAKHNDTRWYRRGDTVLRNNKHWVSAVDHMGEWDINNWNEGYVHTEENFVPEGQILNIAPKIKFDGDFDQAENSINCGFTTGHPLVKAQTESAVDYQGLLNYLRCAGMPASSLVLSSRDQQDIDVADKKVNFHRPSNVRMFNHAWEWAGYANYSKALPEYQRQISEVNKWTYYFTNKNGGKCYVSGFNEEGYQVTVKGLVDLATGDEIAAIDLGTPEEDINRDVTVDIEFAKTIRNDVKYGGIKRRTDDAEGIVHIARIEDAVSDLNSKPDINGQNYRVYYNNKLDEQGAGVIKKPWLEQYVIDKGFVQAPNANVSVVIIHVVPGTPLTGVSSVPYEYPDDEYTRFDEKLWLNYGAPKTITEGIQAASRVYVPVGAEIVISLHGSISETEKGPVQLVNSWAPVVVAGARGVESPTIKMDKDKTKNALDRFPQYSSVYSFSAGVTFCDVTLDLTGSRVIVTFNGGLGVGGSDLNINLKDSGSVALMNASFGESTRFQAYHRLDGPDRKVRVNLESLADNISGDNLAYVGVFGTLSGPSSNVGSGLLGHGVDMVIDFRYPGYGKDSDNAKLTFEFTHSVRGETPLISFYNLGGRGGCRAGGRVGPIIDLDFDNKDWNVKHWISKNWRSNANYQGRHFEIRQPSGSGDRGVYNMTEETAKTMDNTVVLTMGSCVDPNGSDFSCGPFGLIKGAETLLGDNELLVADNDFGSYIYDNGSEKYRNKSGVTFGTEYDVPE